MFGEISGAFRNIFNNPEIEIENDVVLISGINAPQLIKAVSKVWNTSRISKMYLRQTRNQISFDIFFLQDFVFILNEIIKSKYVTVDRRSLNTILMRLKTHPAVASIFKEDYGPGEKKPYCLDFSRLKELNYTLRPHQMEYLQAYDVAVSKYRLRGHLANISVGGGKTITSLSVMHCALVDTPSGKQPLDTVIVLSPKNAIYDVWEKTLLNITKKPVEFWHSLMGIEPTVGKSHYVMHFEAFNKWLPFFSKVIKEGKMGNVGVIIDESHNFNEINSMRTNNLIELSRTPNVHHILWMSGTPIKAMGSECIPLLYSIDPYFSAHRDRPARLFAQIFGKSSDRALSILSNRISLISYRVDTSAVMTTNKLFTYRADVRLKNAADYTLSAIREKMEKFVAERSAYYKENKQKYEDDYMEGIQWYRDSIAGDRAEEQRFNIYTANVKSIKKGYDPILHKDITPAVNKYEKEKIIPTLPPGTKEAFRKAKSVYKYPELTILGEALGSVLGKSRTQCNVDIAANLENMVIRDENNKIIPMTSISDIINNSEKKTLMFTNFVEVVTNTNTVLRQQGYQPILVYGDTNKDLPAIVKQYEEKPEINPLIATFQSLSTAVPLVMANTVVMLNTPYREHDYRQAYGRAYRMGQDKDVHVFNVYLDTGEQPNISTRSKDIMDTMAKQVAIMLGVDKVDLSVATESFGGKRLEGDYDRWSNLLVSIEDINTSGIVKEQRLVDTKPRGILSLPR